MKTHTIFSDFLSALHVKHTSEFSDKQFESMDFKSLFGFSKLLDDYDIPNAGWKVPISGSIEKIKTPFIAQRDNHFEIVKSVKNGEVNLSYNGQNLSLPVDIYEKNFTGVILTASPDSKSIEPNYIRHRVLNTASSCLSIVMVLSFICVLSYLYITRGFYHSGALSVLIAVDLAGLTVTSMLMLKSVNVHLKVADNVCGILQEGGCDKILALNASKFFGLFGWAEVGFGYFIISTAVLLLFPSYVNYLALANLCCLPFTFWSIWYQKFKAKHWCTLCVLTQGLLWCQFICYISGHYEKHFDLCRWEPWILLASYIFSVLLLNKIAELLNKNA